MARANERSRATPSNLSARLGRVRMSLHMALLLGDSIYGMELVLALHYSTHGFA